MKKQPAPPPSALSSSGRTTLPEGTLARLAKRVGVHVREVVEVWTERAAIMEYDGNMSREAAELAAVSDVLAMYEEER